MNLIFKAPDENGVVHQIEMRPLDDEQIVILLRSVRTVTRQVNGKLLLDALQKNRVQGCEQILSRHAGAIGKRFLEVDVKWIVLGVRDNGTAEIESSYLGITGRHVFRRPTASEVLEIIRVGRSGCPPTVPKRVWVNDRALDHLWRRFHLQSAGYEGRTIPLMVRSTCMVEIGKQASAVHAGGANWNPK